MDPTARTGAVIDVGRVIDDAGLSGYQIRLLVLCGLVAVLDGADTFSIGVAAPSIAAGLGMQLNTFGSVFSAALFGATLGAFGFGPLADRFGRKTMLVIAVFIFSIFTFLTALAWSVPSLLTIRFLSGIGLGGATPCFLALASEYAPARMRATITSLLWAGFPLGGMIGGFLNAWLIRAFDWRAMFYVGGVLPFIVGLLVVALVPESLRYLMSVGAAPARLAALISRVAPRRTAYELGTRFVTHEVRSHGVPAAQLFTQGRAWGTVLLWVPFFMAFGVLAIVVLWTPALLRQNGMSASDASLVVAFHGLGGFVGMAAAGWLLQRYGAKVLIPAFVVGAACTATLGTVGTSVVLASVFDGLIGVFVGIGASGLIAFSSLTYPTAIRSTGIGWAMGMGRLGQVAAPLAAGAMLQAGLTIDRVFVVVALAPLVAAVSAPVASWAFRNADRLRTVLATNMARVS